MLKKRELFNKILRGIFKYIICEILIKYIFCFLLGLSLFIVSDSFKNEGTASLINNIAATLFSLPIVFVSYDLYNLAITSKQRKIVNQMIGKEIFYIFMRFVFLTIKFRTDFLKSESFDITKYSSIISSKKSEIFKNISDLKHNGFFIFSEFDNLDTDIETMLNKTLYMKYIPQNELSLLCQFISKYKILKDEFKYINCDDYIIYSNIGDFRISESTHSTSTSDGILYDILHIPSNTIIYTTKFPMFEEDKLLKYYKISGTKAEAIASDIYTLYQLVKKWIALKDNDIIKISNAIVTQNRLFFDADISFNLHMKKNCSIKASWN